MTQPSSPSGPNVGAIKQLFARSGNRCAFPKCRVALVHDGIVMGEICHIRAARPGGPRYDPEQRPAERHAYDNLVLSCSTHHKIIDDDSGSYTVERLTQLKETHASNSVATSDEESESAAQALVAHSIASVSQSGGITAYTVHQVFNLQPPPASIADDRRRGEAKRYLAPELQRTIERIHYIHGRAIANFLCHSTDTATKPTDQKKDFIPHWPSLYPTTPQFRDLGGDDAAALVKFYDSLHALADRVNDWWEREGQLSVNLFNSFLHDASKSLKLALVCIERFGLEALFPPPYEAWGTISDRIRQSFKHEEDVRKHHLARFEARSAKAKTSQLPTTRRR